MRWAAIDGYRTEVYPLIGCAFSVLPTRLSNCRWHSSALPPLCSTLSETLPALPPSVLTPHYARIRVLKPRSLLGLSHADPNNYCSTYMSSICTSAPYAISGRHATHIPFLDHPFKMEHWSRSAHQGSPCNSVLLPIIPCSDWTLRVARHQEREY
jgi:hypothetical protein